MEIVSKNFQPLFFFTESDMCISVMNAMFVWKLSHRINELCIHLHSCQNNSGLIHNR